MLLYVSSSSLTHIVYDSHSGYIQEGSSSYTNGWKGKYVPPHLVCVIIGV